MLGREAKTRLRSRSKKPRQGQNSIPVEKAALRFQVRVRFDCPERVGLAMKSRLQIACIIYAL